MTAQAPTDKRQKETILFLEETFAQHHGIYLDKETSLFETLSSVTAEEASLRASDRTASVAAHVRHMTFYTNLLLRTIRGEKLGKVNWREIWENDRPVTAEQWGGEIQELRRTYADARELIQDPVAWEREDTPGEFTAIAVHTAYHLGAIRQALAVIRSRRETDAAAQ